MAPPATGRSNREMPCSPMKVAIVTTIAGRRSEVINKPCNRPKPAVAGEDQNEASCERTGGDAVWRKERREHHAKPGQRTDRKIDRANQHGRELGTGENRQDAQEGEDALDADADRK